MIAILGILAAVAIPNLISFVGSGADEARATELDTVQIAVIAYAAANSGSWPTAITGLTSASAYTDLDAYIMGTHSSLQGTYTITAGGVVTSTAYPGT